MMTSIGGRAKEEQVARAVTFRSLHHRDRVLLLPNAWDAGSVRLFDRMGFEAIATTSGGVAWSLGYADGEAAPLEEVLAVIRRMVRVTNLPLTVDFEAGYGDTPTDVTRSVHRVIEAGAVGINLEDGIRHERLREIPDAAQRIRAAREAANETGVPLVINARVDSWIVGSHEGVDSLIAETIQRAAAYLDAGADAIYPIALADPAVIQRLCSAIGAPVNIGARAELPDLAELRRLGVARVSTATRIATVALSAARDAALRLQQSGMFDGLDAPWGYENIQALFFHDTSDR